MDANTKSLVEELKQAVIDTPQIPLNAKRAFLYAINLSNGLQKSTAIGFRQKNSEQIADQISSSMPSVQQATQDIADKAEIIISGGFSEALAGAGSGAFIRITPKALEHMPFETKFPTNYDIKSQEGIDLPAYYRQ